MSLDRRGLFMLGAAAAGSAATGAGAAPRGMAGLVPAADFPQPKRATYLNCAALGLIAEPVRRHFVDISNSMARDGTQFFFAHGEEFGALPKAAAAKLMGTKPENIGLATSISDAISQVAWWLRPRKGQNVVTIDIECPATTMSFLRIAQETGAEVRMTKVWDNPGALTTDMVINLIDRNTVAVSVSHVQWVTGYRLDLKRLAAAAHAHGAILIVDAMHTFGVVPLDVEGDDVDVLVAGAYKWLCGFPGIAPVYMKPELLQRFVPTFMGAQSPDPVPPYEFVDGRRYVTPTGTNRWVYGSSSHEARAALGTAGEYIAKVGLDRIERHVHGLTAQLAEGLKRLGAKVATPDNPKERAGIVAAVFPGRVNMEVFRAFEAGGLYTSPRSGHIRFACHLFNDEAGVDQALSIMRKTLA